jgi:hypothetical protein
VCERAKGDTATDLSLVRCRAARHVIFGPNGEEHLILRDADRALTLKLHGSRASMAPVSPTFLVRGIPNPHTLAADFGGLAILVNSPRCTPHRTRERLFMRDALVALDARCVGATYRETAAVIYGAERAKAAWSSASTAMKQRIRHGLARAEQFRDGAYRKLLE